jgi:glycosyltransferase involved in cell wall biosynthesis
LERAILPYNERLSWTPYAVAEANRLYRTSKYDVVLSTSPPVAAHLAALALKRRYQLKWIADLRDPLLDNPFRTRRGARLYDATLERCLFRNADALIANTDAVAETWRERYPKWRHKISVIWNGFDPEEVISPRPIPPRGFRLMLHAGALYGGRTPQVLLASIQRLIRDKRLAPDRLRIELLGSLEETSIGPFPELVRQGLLRYNGVMVPRQEALEQMSAADFLLLVDLNELNAGLQVPAKLFDYLRIGRPIIAITSRNSPAERILMRSAARHTCLYPDEAEQSVDDKTLAFINADPETIVANAWFYQEFDGRSQAQCLAKIISRRV